ncbi:MAG: hypothetical protein CVT48_01125 [Thermoplasmata archaeon HGW-Thermoplasmata-1]|nr:MAG: hypothetical protein CVT48_01125 [Thermoplasmata archaeon HGW-Thermoplasmata-1]
MIDAYKNISTTYYLVGLKPLDAAILLMAAFLPLLLSWWLLSVIVSAAGYQFAKKHRERHYGWLDLGIYLTAPERYSVVMEMKNDY